MIEKIVLRDQVRQYLQREMLDRKITIGERLSLAEIARKINVSVTPVREALTQLEQAGIVMTIANRGFFIPPLSVEEALQIYPVIISLETMAVSESGYSTDQIEELREIQLRFEKAKSREQLVRLDLEFHKALLKPFRNRIACRILKDLKVRVFLYELEYMDYMQNRQNSANCHRQIIRSLEKKHNTQAADLLKENWEMSLRFLVEFYTEKA